MSVVSLARMARVTGPWAKGPRGASPSRLAAETSMTPTAPPRTISSVERGGAGRVFSPPRSAGPAAATPSAMSLSPASAMTKSAGVKDPERIRESFRSSVFMLGASGAWRDARLRAAPDARQAPQTKAATGGGVDSAPAALSNAGIASPQGGFPKRAAACSEHAATPGRGFGARGFPEEIMTLHSRSAIWLLAAVAVLVAGTAGPARAADVFIGLITKTDSNPFFVKMREGADATAKKVGARVQSFAGKFDGDNDTQVAAIENLISAGAKGILITPSDTKAIVPTVKKARDAGILVIALDTPLEPIEAADATFATDNFKAGLLIGEWAAKTLGAKTKTAHVAFLDALEDRKSTRLNSSHSQISYAVFCLKKKKKK